MKAWISKYFTLAQQKTPIMGLPGRKAPDMFTDSGHL
jgi:hypothetical protein